MAKQSTSTSKTSKSRKTENLGKGKVTPVQIAFIVDRYLSDNNFAQTRSTFRTEASDLISRSPVQEAPKSLLSLSAMLDEYIRLKEQKVLLDQERCRLEQENFRVHNLLRGMQDVMNAFNASAHVVTPPPPLQLPAPNVASTMPKSGIRLPTVELPIGSPAGYSVITTPIMMSQSEPSNTRGYLTSISSPITNHKDSKRKGSKDVAGAPPINKRLCRSSTTKQLPLKDTSTCSQPFVLADTSTCSQPCYGDNNQEISQKHTAAKSLSHANASSESTVKGSNAVQSSNIVKCLFNQATQSPPANSSGPKTPPLASSSQADKSASPLEIGSTATSVEDVPQKFTSTNCTIISSETIRVSPAKQIAYYSIARNQHISASSPVEANLKRPNKRDHVKGRLNFDAHDTQTTSEEPDSNKISPSESVKEADILDLDLANLDALGDINFSELLVDFDLDGEGISYSCQQAIDSSPDSTSWSPGKSGSVNIGANQFMSQVSSTVTEILSDKDMNLSGPDSVTTVRSVTKCIKILSPVKRQRSLLDQENLPAKD